MLPGFDACKSVECTYIYISTDGIAGSGLLGIGATVVECTIACDAANQGTVVGEPHFIGFDGSRYDFQGMCKS